MEPKKRDTTVAKEKPTQDVAIGNGAMGAGGDGELYCLCRTPYDQLRFMIGCDGCDQWFHGECVGVSESESELVDMYFCPDCTGMPRSDSLFWQFISNVTISLIDCF